MVAIGEVQLPPELELLSVTRNTVGDTNDVFFCQARFQGRAVDAYVKIARHPGDCLANERAVLEALGASAVPVARVLWYASEPRAVLVLEALRGNVLWDYIDPRRGHYDQHKVPAYLQSYGECLATIHELPLAWAAQKRPRLGDLIGEQDTGDRRFEEPVSWLRGHAPPVRDEVFVHGDLNTASVLYENVRLTGVIDWEFAGRGWREYDLAWILRARTAFLNTQAERDAILEGYRRHSSYDEAALRWCEVLNYLHFAYWDRQDDPAYTAFALQRAAETAGR